MSSKTLCGIYSITCKPSGRVYVGQSIDIHTRWKNHKSALNRGTVPNKILQSSWKKYGQDSFLFEILELCIEEKLDEREHHWINKLGCWAQQGGMNIYTIGRDKSRNIPVSAETKDKISRIKSKKYDVLGKTITLKEGSEITGVGKRCIAGRLGRGWCPTKAFLLPPQR